MHFGFCYETHGIFHVWNEHFMGCSGPHFGAAELAWPLGHSELVGPKLGAQTETGVKWSNVSTVDSLDHLSKYSDQ